MNLWNTPTNKSLYRFLYNPGLTRLVIADWGRSEAEIDVVLANIWFNLPFFIVRMGRLFKVICSTFWRMQISHNAGISAHNLGARPLRLCGEKWSPTVIVSAALLFCIEINIIDWQGVSLQIVLVSKSKHNIHIPNLQMYYVLLAETDQDSARHSHPHTGNSFRLYREPLHAPIQTAIGSQGLYMCVIITFAVILYRKCRKAQGFTPVCASWRGKLQPWHKRFQRTSAECTDYQGYRTVFQCAVHTSDNNSVIWSLLLQCCRFSMRRMKVLWLSRWTKMTQMSLTRTWTKNVVRR